MALRPIRTPRWRQWSEQEARDVLAQFAQSDLSIATFAHSIGCSVRRIQYWRDTLRTPARTAHEAFVPVQVRSSHTIKLLAEIVASELPEDTRPERIADIVVAIAQWQRPC